VTREANGAFYELVARFGERTGVPVILNTSFNVMGMPIDETPHDALQCVMATGLDYCVIGNAVVRKRRKILLGLDAKARDTSVKRGEDPVQRRPTFTRGPLPLKDYAGRYEQGVGTLNVYQEQDRLVASFIGMTTSLRHDAGHGFIATDKPFQDSLFNFMVNPGSGIVDALSVIVGPGMGETGEVFMWRVFVTGADGRDHVDQFIGEYGTGSDTLKVMLAADGRLAVTAEGQPVYELVKGRGARFDLKNTPGYSIEFMTDGPGPAREIVVTQPNGVFLLGRN
jgi:hypothetical protein